jgi:hypothetical protein
MMFVSLLFLPKLDLGTKASSSAFVIGTLVNSEVGKRMVDSKCDDEWGRTTCGHNKVNA